MTSIMCLKGPPSPTPSVAGSWQGLYRLFFILGRMTLYYYETTDARNMELNKIANEIANEILSRIHGARAQGGNTTSFLLPNVAWRRPSFQRMAQLGCSAAVAGGLQHSGSGLRCCSCQQQAAAVIATAYCQTLRSLWLGGGAWMRKEIPFASVWQCHALVW